MQPAPSPLLLEDENAGLFGNTFGLLGREKIGLMLRRKMIRSPVDINPLQLQPASLDLRLGARAYRVRASFLPGRERSVEEQLKLLKIDEIGLKNRGAVLEKGGVYVIPLLESLHCRKASPRSRIQRVRPAGSTFSRG